MSEELPVLPDPVDVGDIEELVARYAPDIRPVLSVRTRLGSVGFSLLAAGYAWMVHAYVLYGEAYLSKPGTLLVGALWLALGLVGGEVISRYVHRSRLRIFRRLVEETPWVIHGEIAARFRREIQAQRDRTMGAGSEWHAARQPLQDAFDQANRSMAYWRERLKQDPSNEVTGAQLATAERLTGKFSDALGELDKRSEVLVQFFNDCEAKLSVLEYSKRDFEESRRLSELSDKAEGIIFDATATLASIGRQFVTEAVRVGEALGAVERLQIKESAGDVPLDRIEAVADRIIESSEREQAALAGLVSRLTPDDK